MKISIAGKDVEIGSALQEYIKNHFAQIEKRYHDSIMSSSIVVSKESHKHAESYKVDIIVTEKPKTGGRVLKASDVSDTAYKAFDNALHKMKSQLQKHKDKVKSHHVKHSNKETHSFIASNE